MSEVVQKEKKTIVDIALVVMALTMVIYHGAYLFYPFFNALLHQNVHLGLSITFICLFAIRQSKTKLVQILWLFILVTTVIVCLYIHIEYERLHMWAGYPEFVDIIVGFLLVGVVTCLTFVYWGAVFPILAAIAVLYALFGHNISGPLGHPYLEPKLILSNMGIGFEGIFGMMLNTSANVIFFFIIFGSLFEAVGITRFFQAVGRFIGGKMRGGSAIGSILSSSMLGMCTGGSMVNVALAGSFTLPMMTEAKFKPTIAGGIEACSSTGGGLTPPVMGIAIFIMASFLNIPYLELIPATIIPAFIFYLGLILGVVLIIQRDDIPMCSVSYDPAALRLAYMFVVPISVLCFLLFSRYSPAYAAFWTTITLIIVATIRAETRFTFASFIDGLVKGCQNMATLAIVLAMIGIFVSMINLTNAGPKLSAVIQILSGGYMIPSLVLTMVLCILLGCALPAPVAYMVVALVVTPGMQDMGISIVSTHLFCFYFSFLSNITPPIAGSSMVAAKMLNVSFMRTSWESFKFALPFFVVPYFVIFNPIVTMEAQAPVDAIIALVMLLSACFSIAFATWGYFRGALNTIERILFTLSAIICTISGLESGSTSLYFGIAGLGLFTFLLAIRYKNGVKNSLFPKIKPDEFECVI